jgi:hypothetical protein
MSAKDTVEVPREFLIELHDYVTEVLSLNEWKRGTTERNDKYIETVEHDIEKIRELIDKFERKQ